MARKGPFFYIRLALSICIGSSALDLQDPLSKFQTSVFLVKMLHILPRVVQRHNNNKQIKASTRDVQQQISFTLKAGPAECHRSGR